MNALYMCGIGVSSVAGYLLVVLTHLATLSAIYKHVPKCTAVSGMW